MRKTPLKRKSKSPSAILRDDIQEYVRLIVTKRDKGCILRSIRGCNALADVIDHEITRLHMQILG